MIFLRAKHGLTILFGCMLLFLVVFSVLYGLVRLKTLDTYENLMAKTALLDLLGMPMIAASDECTGTKNSLEGLCGCLSEIPGGYCYHTDCDTTSTPEILAIDRYSLEKGGDW